MKTLKHVSKSFKFQLIFVFGTIIIITVILLSVLSYYNAVDVLEKNMEELTSISLSQTSKSVEATLDTYKDLLYQIYSDDEVVKLVDQINDGENVALSRNQLRRTLRGMANVKNDIQSITIITSGGDITFYDKLTAATTSNSWLNINNGMSRKLYEQVSDSSHTEILPTSFAGHYTARPYYLFHLAHRIVDYRNIYKQNAVVIISIDADLLNRICNENVGNNEEQYSNSFYFIADKEGKLISYPEQKMLGEQIHSDCVSDEECEQEILNFVREGKLVSGKTIRLRSYFDGTGNWYYYNVSDQSGMLEQLSQQQKWTFTTIIISILATSLIVYVLSGHLTASIHVIVKSMEKAQQGEMTVQAEISKNMPSEIKTIASQFNRMIMELQNSMKKEHYAIEKQKNAEILALEAQINPHFLYNILDTINWMAIDREEYEISDTISALGHILRYGISNSTGIVTIHQEMEWLEKYIQLQKTRLKGTFDCELKADPEILDCRIHKLLLQPFVENAFLHGFEGVKRHHVLKIEITGINGQIRILIQDNGKGMSQELLEHLLKGEEIETQERNHIGIQNAIGRLNMYYPREAQAIIKSEMNVGTSIILEITSQEVLYEDCNCRR